jgi:hypothetical protein
MRAEKRRQRLRFEASLHFLYVLDISRIEQFTIEGASGFGRYMRRRGPTHAAVCIVPDDKG